MGQDIQFSEEVITAVVSKSSGQCLLSFLDPFLVLPHDHLTINQTKQMNEQMNE